MAYLNSFVKAAFCLGIISASAARSKLPTNTRTNAENRELAAGETLAVVRVNDIIAGGRTKIAISSAEKRASFDVRREGVYSFRIGRKRATQRFAVNVTSCSTELEVLMFDKQQHRHTKEYYLPKGKRVVFHVIDEDSQQFHEVTARSRLPSRSGLEGNAKTLVRAKRPDNVIKRRRRQAAVGNKGMTSGHAIAFSVASTKSFSNSGDVIATSDGELSSDSKMTFNKVFVNEGGGFRKETGEFIAPTDGVYYFSFTVGKYPKKKLSVALIKNENLFQVLIYNDSRTKRREMQSQNVMLMLREGDTVWLKAFDSPGFAVYSNHGNYITFNGYLLHAT